MKLLGLMLMVILMEYIVGADINTNSTAVNGGNEMRMNIMDFAILPNKIGEVDMSMPKLTADDMLRTISALDDRYDYKIYKSFNEQYLVYAVRKGANDTMMDMQYMNIGDIKSWHNDKLDETLGRTKEDI